MKSIFKVLFIIFTTFIFIITIFISIAGGILFYNSSNADFVLKTGYKPISIYDKNDNLVSTNSYYYSYVPIDEISKNIINAFISIEDRNFYKHNGFNIKRIISSLYNNIANNDIHGASTITQQYVKNIYLSNEKTLERKLKEIAIAFNLEKKYTKNQILEAYLNSILFGENIYGIKMASLYYFNKNPKDLNLSEACYLAGMIQAPNYYNAYNNPSKANERKNIVLKAMLDSNYITQSDYEREINIDIKELLSVKSLGYKGYISSYIDYIYSILPESIDGTKDIYTYLDVNIQKDLYNIITNKYELFNDDSLNCAIVVLDNKNYGVLAIAGNRNTDKKVLDYASAIKLQPGSVIKPILDYAPAIEYLGYSPATLINDEPYTYKDGTIVNNYDDSFLGVISLRKALSDSRNIPAIKLFNEVGYERAFEFAGKIGIFSNEIYEADAIGGAKNGYTLLELANAYQAFANLGYYKKATGIRKLQLENSTIYNDDPAILAMKPTTAWLINNILHDVFKNSSYNLTNTYLMAKTGQTNYDFKTLKKYNIPVNATKDSLLVAYTKDLTIGVWVGYNTISSNNYLDRYKKNIPRNIMKILLGKYANDNEYYDIIPGITKKYITNYNNQIFLAKDNGYYEYFVLGTEPYSYPVDYYSI